MRLFRKILPREPAPELDALNPKGSRIHRGFSSYDEAFVATRQQRALLVQRFLAVMAAAGNPGQKRVWGTSVRQLVGQHSEHYWSTVVTNEHGHYREFMVFDDGRHGWSDEISYSDRPRNDIDEVSPRLLRQILGLMLAQQSLSWQHPTAPWFSAFTRDESGQMAPSISAEKSLVSPLQDLHRREIRYGVLMGLRIVFLLLAALLVATDVDNAGVWAVISIGIAMVLPWVAVMVANERYRRRG